MTRTRRPSAATLNILKCLSGTHDGLHGYALMKGSELASGTLYPILGRLTERGWLEKTWETDSDSSGPPRRIYKLTDLGRAQFKNYAEEEPLNSGGLNLGAIR